MVFRLFVPILLAPLLCLGGCNNYSHQLERGQSYYEQNEYEKALALWRTLDSSRDSLSDEELVRYCYLRGMTDYRLNFRPDARYWLGLAKAAERDLALGLNDDEKARMEDALQDLYQEVYQGAEVGAGSPPDDAKSASSKKCNWTSDCEQGSICNEGVCSQVQE